MSRKIRSTLVVLAASLACAFGQGRPLVQFDFADLRPDGSLPNRGTAPWTGKAAGNYRLLPGGILKLDGLTGQVTVPGSEDFDVATNATFSLLYRREKRADNDRVNQSMDAFFAKRGVFIMTKYHHNFYANVHDGKDWVATCQITDTFPEVDLEWHHVAMSIEYFKNWAEAEEWVEFTFYVDGVCVGRRRYKDVRIRKVHAPIEIGFNTGMGAPWRLAGEIADPRIYGRVLSENEIRTLTMGQKLARRRFKLERKLAETDRKAIRTATPSEPLRHALANLAVLDTGHVDRWRSALAEPARHITIMPGRSSDLAVAELDGFAHVCSWFDRTAGRELLKGDNCLLRWRLKKGGRLSSYSPLDRAVESRLVRRPRQDAAGGWAFSVGYRVSGETAMSGEAEFRFYNDRLEFTHLARATSPGTAIFDVDYPSFSFRGFDGPGETLVVPNGCGVPHARPTAGSFRYSHPYPRAFNSMQFVCYYDRLGGLYVATEDPRGRQKQTTVTCAPGRVDGSYRWRVPYDEPDTNNDFKPECRVAAELFRGDWYDAGLIYRRVLGEIRAPWWRRTLPNTDSPDHLRENSVWLTSTYLGELDETILQVRRYLGQDLYLGDIWKWWEEGRGVNLAPTMRQMPEWIEYLRQLRKWGVRCQPYIDGRLWGERDRRGEDYMYSSFGHKLNVVSDGVPVREMYSSNPSDVLCPATRGYQEHFFDFINTLTAQGTDGLYIDQLGACFQPPCHQAREHGHRYADWDVWYLKGYRKLLCRLREHWRQKGVRKVLSTEDNAEMLVGLMDAMEVYRWTTEGQVPLYPLVYSGRTQFYARNVRDKLARFQTVAEQLVNSEQLGAFGIGELASPFNEDLRRYVKRLAWLRRAMLDFFDRGMMARPGTFRDPMPRHRRFWSDFGTRYVTKPQVQSAVWQLDGVRAAVLVNTEAEPAANTFVFEAPNGCRELLVYQDDRPAAEKLPVAAEDGKVSFGFRLPVHGCLLAVACPLSGLPAELGRRIDDAFRTVRGARLEDDPFGVSHLPETSPIDPFSPVSLLDAKWVVGARRNRTLDRIDYVSYAMLYPGVVDFGDKAPGELVIQVACGTPQGGRIQMLADGIGERDMLAEIVLAPDFRTRHWNDYVPLTAKLRRRLTGRHKVIFAVKGKGFCNLRKWRVK